MTKMMHLLMLSSLVALAYSESQGLRDDVPNRNLNGEESLPGYGCGHLGQRCCNGECIEYDQYSGSFLTCNSLHQCVKCGEDGDICCDDGACAAGNVCYLGICTPCGSEFTDPPPSGYAPGPYAEETQYGGAGYSPSKPVRPLPFPQQPCCDGMKCAGGFVCVESGVCEVCGDENEVCCAGMKCNSDEALVCNEDGTCVLCGEDGQQCCDGMKCDDDLVCAADGTCVQCGETGEPCCDGMKCSAGNVCTDEGICLECGTGTMLCCDGMKCEGGFVCLADGLCAVCGDAGQPCCDGMKCATEAVCNEDGTCEACGAPGQTCCDGMKCAQGSLCTHDGDCALCGADGQPCCDGMKCDSTDEDPLICTTAGCVSCGGEDEPCCTHKGPPCEVVTCADDGTPIPLVCGTDGFCERPAYPYTVGGKY